jgi:membrane fusion protein, multidrug efflux system
MKDFAFIRGRLPLRSIVSRYVSRYVVPLTAVSLLLGACKSQKPRAMGAPPPVPVAVATATRESIPIQIRAVGSAAPSETVQIESQITGQLVSVRFQEGTEIKKGDLLFEIDARPYQQALQQAQNAVTRDQAQLQQAEANRARDAAQAKNAAATAQRYEDLSKAGVVSKEQFDQVRTNAEALQESVRAGEAAIESARASLQSDSAAVERAKLDLAYCEIRAPLSGRAGNVLIHAGNLVRANASEPLVVINQITPMFVTFGVPEMYLPAIRESMRGRKLPVDVSPQNDPAKVVRGSLSVIDNTVDASTGTIRLKALFGNQERVLWPGQFVNVVLTLETRNDVTVVPSEAVQTGQQGQFVFVVKQDDTAETRNVTVGDTVGGKIIIEKGMTPGERVVTDGQLRLFPGARIKPVAADLIDSQKL